MEYPVMESGSLLSSGIKKHVKDKRMSKTAKLNVSLASKIKTKIINNSSIFKISLKHNNRALAQALSREKENSRRITTEKMLLQKEVEKLNFENTFLRLKLNNLNKKLIEIEAHMNNNLITAIEMSTLSEFHQSPFVLPASKNKRVSKQCKSMHLPFARVPLTSNDDDDDDDDEDTEKMQCDDNIISNTSSDVPSSVSTRQSLSTQYNLELLCLTENNQNVCGLDDSERISSIVDILPKESNSHSDQSSKSSLMGEMKNSQAISHRKEKRSLSNITKRKRHASFLESNNPSSDNPCVTDLDQQGISSAELNWNNEINDRTNEVNIKMQGNTQCLPDSSESASEPTAQCVNQVQSDDDFQWQKTVYDADMDLTASEVSQIVTVSKGTKTKSNKTSNDCGIKTFRKVKDSRSDKKRIRSKRQIKSSSEVNVEEKIENEPEKRSVGLNDNRNSEDPNFVFNTEQLTQLNILKTVNLHNDFDQDDKQSTEGSKKKRARVTNEQEETCSFSQSSDKFQQESKFNMGQSSLACNKNKASRQTFVIHKLEKGHLFLNQKDKETISENLEVTDEFQTADLTTTKHNGNLCDFETQNMFDSKKDVTDTQPAQQNESKINKKLRQKVNRKTQIISEMDQIYRDNDKDEHGPQKGNFSIQTQEDKEIISGNLENPSEFQTPALSTKNSGSLYDYETQNVLRVKKHVHDIQTACQNETKIDKKLRQKVCRRTEIISEINQVHENNDKDGHDPEKGNLFSLIEKDKDIPENLEDSNGFQVADPSTRGNRNLCGYETQNILGEKKCVTNMPPAKQNESKISKRLRGKGSQKTEIILEMNQINDFNNKSVHDSEKGNNFSLTQKDKESISENSEVTNEFQTAYLSTKDNGNLNDYKTLNMSNLKKHVTDMQLAQQNDSKTNKLRQKVNRKTQIISEWNQIYRDNDKDMHGLENYTRDCNFKISESKQRLECQGIFSGYYIEINSNEKENCEQISKPYKQVKKHGKESSVKTKDILAQGENKPIFQLDSLQTSLSLESGLKYVTNETDSDSGNQMEAPKNTTLNKKRDDPFAEVIKGECQVKRISKKTSQSKKRKTFIAPSPDSHEVMQIIPDPSQRVAVETDHADEGKKLENQKMKPDFYPKAFNSLSQIYSPNIPDSFLNNVHEGSRPVRISSSKNLIMKENFAQDCSPVFPVSFDMQKTTGKKCKVTQRTQTSGGRTLQDLTNTNFVSNNTVKVENNSEGLSLELPSRRRKCTPLHFKEPSLRDKMRR